MSSQTASREALPTIAEIQAMTKAQKRAAAEQGLGAMLTSIRRGDIALGDWEKISIENALMMIDHGLYTVALHEIVCATWPMHDRSPRLNISARTAARTLDDFERALERMMRHNSRGLEGTAED